MRFRLAKWLATIVAVTPLTVGISGCESKRTSDRELKFVNSTEAQQLINGGRKLMVLKKSGGAWVDPRSEKLFQSGHIPGAINLPYERVTLEHKILKDYDVVVVYGDDYNDARANGMSKRLMELGHNNVHTLQGGLRAWADSGNRLETEDIASANATP